MRTHRDLLAEADPTPAAMRCTVCFGWLKNHPPLGIVAKTFPRPSTYQPPSISHILIHDTNNQQNIVFGNGTWDSAHGAGF